MMAKSKETAPKATGALNLSEEGEKALGFAKDVLMDPKVAAAFIGHDPDTLRDWRWKGIGPEYYRLNRNIRYPLSGLMRWLAARKVTPQGPEVA